MVTPQLQRTIFGELDILIFIIWTLLILVLMEASVPALMELLIELLTIIMIVNLWIVLEELKENAPRIQSQNGDIWGLYVMEKKIIILFLKLGLQNMIVQFIVSVQTPRLSSNLTTELYAQTMVGTQTLSRNVMPSQNVTLVIQLKYFLVYFGIKKQKV